MQSSEQHRASGTDVRKAANLCALGFDGQTVPVRIVKDGRVLAANKVKLTGGSQRAELEFTPTQPGFQTFQVEVPVQHGERLVENNRREFGMTVVDLVMRVIYMEANGVQKGVFQPLYVKHALEEIPGIEVKTPYVDPKNGDKIYRVQNSTNGYPRTLEELLKYHVVIFSDVSTTDFTQQQLEATERFVTEFGGGFVMVGGHTSFGAGGYQHSMIDNLIPVAMDRESDLTQNNFVPRVPDTPTELTDQVIETCWLESLRSQRCSFKTEKSPIT